MNKIQFELKEKCGIYMIVNLKNGKRYVGSSVDIYNRIHEHVHNLNRNKAHNKHLQNSWNKYGQECFIYSILEYCDVSIRFEREQYYIDCIKPEYNLTLNVVANFGHSVTDSTKEKISKTLKQKYASGEITIYRQNHAWKKTYIYNIKTYKLEAVCDCAADAGKILRKNKDRHVIENNLYRNRYIITYSELKNMNELVNYINKNYLNINSKFGKYLICENSSGMKYYRTLTECARDNFSSKSTLSKHSNATKENPYIIRQSQRKFYYSNEYIPVNVEAVPIEKSSELLSGNIGENPTVEDNTEINLETKKSKSSYSVEDETINRI